MTCLIKLVICLLSMGCVTSVNPIGAARTSLSDRPATQIVPSFYIINIQPFMDTADERQFTFEGNVAITIRASIPDITQIELHSSDLEFTLSDIGVQHSETNGIVNLEPDSLIMDPDSEIARFTLTSGLYVHVDYIIRIAYRGTIRNDNSGMFRMEYLENGITEYLVATQLEPTYARRMFPCLDDPAMKARFTFNVERPENYDVVLANTMFQSPSQEIDRFSFPPTPPMSPFLAAFIICNFKRARHIVDDDGNELSFWTRRDFQEQTIYAFELTQKLLKGFKEQVGINYHSSEDIRKLDIISFPRPTSGPTQNWGLIKAREAFLMYHPEETNAFDKESIAQTISHGISQMFFGNLVTLEWWDSAWVNYGLATYLGNCMQSIVEPSFEASSGLITGTINGGILNAMKLDQTVQFPALVNGMHYPWGPDSSHVISFYKSAAIMRMLHYLIGDNGFRFGISKYLNKHQYDVASAQDFYEAMRVNAHGHNTLEEYPGSTISNVVSPWVTNAGYPLLRVLVNRATKLIKLSQNRFYENTDTSNELYAIPITYSIGSSPNFNDTKPKFILSKKSHTFTEYELGEDDFIIFNNQFIGYMRIVYDDISWSKIAKALHSTIRTRIHVLNRAQIVDDVFEFMMADLLDLRVGFDLLNFLQEETNYHVWASAAFGISKLRNKMRIEDTNRQLFENRVLKWMSLAIEKFGFSEKRDDNHTTKKHRSLIANLACQLGYADCLHNATAYLSNFINHFESVPTNLRSFAYCYGLQQGDGAAYDFLANYHTDSSVPSEYLTHKLNLGCTGLPTRVERYLNQVVFSDSIEGDDLARALLAPLRNSANVLAVYDFVRKHFQAIETKIGTMDYLMTGMIYHLHNDVHLGSALSWIRSCVVCSDSTKETTEAAIERRRLSFEWSDTYSEKLRSILSDVPSSANSILMWLSFPFVTVLTLITYGSI